MEHADGYVCHTADHNWLMRFFFVKETVDVDVVDENGEKEKVNFRDVKKFLPGIRISILWL